MAERTLKSSKDKGPSSQAGPDDSESKRLRDRAVSKGSLARTKATSSDALQPSKAILKCNGKDVVKRGHRKNKYLFSFPGLLAPVTGGVLGELAQLDTKNPVMYITLPEGRMKLFGTLVYPKNKYLTLHFSKGDGNITCEDCFENMVVFSECWWVGSKEENPSEARLEIPKTILKTHDTFDFTGGAGRRPETGSNDATTSKPGEATLNKRQEEGTPEPEASDSGLENAEEAGDAGPEPSSSRRKSSRTAGKTFKFAEPRSDDDLEKDGSDSDSDDAPLRQPAARPVVSKEAPKKSRQSDTSAKEKPKRRPVTIDLDTGEEDEKHSEPSQSPPRSKRKAASSASAPGSRTAKKLRKDKDDDTGDDSNEDLSDLSESASDSDEE